MLAIEMTFPAGRFHATPWDRQVNEGAVEWPPSPWRLLRALVSVWRHKACHVDETCMRALIDALASPPAFQLPAASQGHTRHYMPVAGGKTSKIFDTFVLVAREDPLIIAWPDVEFDASTRSLLASLLNVMNYFGRSESWVTARLLDECTSKLDTVPLDQCGDPENCELIRVLCPVEPQEHLAWWENMRRLRCAEALKQKLEKRMSKGKPTDGVKLTSKETAAVDESLPAELFDALHADTGLLRAQGWNRAPGSEWIDYARPADAFSSVRSSRPVPARTARPRPTTARFAVAGAVRPRLTESVWRAEDLRLILMGCSKAANGDDNASRVFSGKDAEGQRLGHGHRHAHILCEAAGPDGCITHITVHAADGFSRDDERALSRLAEKGLWGHGGHNLQLVLLGVGRPEDFGGWNERAGRSRILHEASVWRSRTPFVPTRHFKLKRSERSDPALRAGAIRRELVRQLRLELSSRDHLARFAETVEIEPLLHRDECGTMLGRSFTRWLKFRRRRRRSPIQPPSPLGYALRLTFPESVRGPLALGYASHFGLGQFTPVTHGDEAGAN